MSDNDKITVIGFKKNGGTGKGTAGTRSSASEPPKKGNNKPKGPDAQRLSKIDRENEVAPPKTISLRVSQAVQAARGEKEWTQIVLARKISEPLSVIKAYELGNAIPDQIILAKLERALGVKLRGADDDIGKKLGPKKKT